MEEEKKEETKTEEKLEGQERELQPDSSTEKAESSGEEEKQAKEPSGESKESETIKEIKKVFNVEQLKETVESALHESTVRRIKIKNRNGRVVMDIPLWLATVGGVGAVWAFLPGAIVGLLASIAMGVTVEIERVEEKNEEETK